MDRPLPTLLWLFAAAAAAFGLAAQIDAHVKGDALLPSLPVFISGGVILTLSAIGALRGLKTRPVGASVLGLPLRDYAFAGTFAALVALAGHALL